MKLVLFAIPDDQDPNDVFKDDVDIPLIAQDQVPAKEFLASRDNAQMVSTSMGFAMERGLKNLRLDHPLMKG